MTKLEQLIEELCPEGVKEYRVADVADTFIGLATSVTKYKADSGVQLLHNSDISEGKINVKTLEYITDEFAQKNSKKLLRTNDIITVHTGDVGTSAIITEEFDGCIGFTTISSRVKDTDFLIPEYLCVFLNSNLCKEQIASKTISDRNNLNLASFDEILIPIPHIDIQREIVSIINNFAELTAELTARKKQYEYYRDELLKPKADIPMVTLGEIATDIFRGAGIKKDEVTDEGIPCVRYGEIYTTYHTWFTECVSHTKLEYVQSPKWFEHGDILFAITGESVEDIATSVAYIGNEKCLAGGDIVVMKHNQNPRYLAHVLATQAARTQKSKGKVKSKVVHSSVPSIQQISIPLPPLDVQERYANILDHFEAICTDLNIGLPAEIEARKLQYEYYRDLLLTFAEDSSQFVNVERERESSGAPKLS